MGAEYISDVLFCLGHAHDVYHAAILYNYMQISDSLRLFLVVSETVLGLPTSKHVHTLSIA